MPAEGSLAGKAETVQFDHSTPVHPGIVELGEISMLAYIMVGTNNVKRAAKFYNAALAPLGLVQTGSDNRYVGYGPKNAPKKSQFYVTKPYNKKLATFGNGTMISLVAKSRRAVDEFHAAALANGGTDEGKPGPAPLAEATMRPTRAIRTATRSVPTWPRRSRAVERFGGLLPCAGDRCRFTPLEAPR